MAWWLVISLTLIGVWLLAYAFSGPKKKAGPLNISGEVEPAAPLARPAMPLPAKPEAKADAWDTGILRHSFDEHELTALAEIDYTDSQGQQTRRQIEITYFYPQQRAILARCYLRNASRSFLTDRRSRQRGGSQQHR
jgi:predicted DNA-binding transcriptional regulator YafY